MDQGLKKSITMTGGLILLALIVVLLMPKERADQISESMRRLVGDSGIVCLDYHRKSLKDPESAKLIWSSKTAAKDFPEVKITYKAQNSFGAYITSESGCTLNSDGSVNESLTSGEQLVTRAMEKEKRLKEELECLIQRKNERTQGNVSADKNYSACLMK